MKKSKLIAQISALQGRAYSVSLKNGFWLGPKGELDYKLNAIQKELDEAKLKDMTPDKHLPEYSNMAVELADVILMTMDTAAGFGINLAEIVAKKAKFNETRQYKSEQKYILGQE